MVAERQQYDQQQAADGVREGEFLETAGRHEDGLGAARTGEDHAQRNHRQHGAGGGVAAVIQQVDQGDRQRRQPPRQAAEHEIQHQLGLAAHARQVLGTVALNFTEGGVDQLVDDLQHHRIEHAVQGQGNRILPQGGGVNHAGQIQAVGIHHAHGEQRRQDDPTRLAQDFPNHRKIPTQAIPRSGQPITGQRQLQNADDQGGNQQGANRASGIGHRGCADQPCGLTDQFKHRHPANLQITGCREQLDAVPAADQHGEGHAHDQPGQGRCGIDRFRREQAHRSQTVNPEGHQAAQQENHGRPQDLQGIERAEKHRIMRTRAVDQGRLQSDIGQQRDGHHQHIGQGHHTEMLGHQQTGEYQAAAKSKHMPGKGSHRHPDPRSPHTPGQIRRLIHQARTGQNRA